MRAGADVIETNTFGANRFKLANFGLADKTRAINLQGARIARHAAREAAWVAGSIGPLGVRIEPWGRTGVDEAEAAFREQAAALAEGGVDLFILETFRDLNELSAAIRAVRAVSTLPIVAQMTTDDDGNSLDGTPPETFAPALERAGADVIGVNCSVGPAAMLETIERWRGSRGARLSAQPNAGRPRDVDGRNLYLCSPDYMATLRAPVHRGRRAAGRRLLRHDARSHPADRAGGAHDGAGRGAARARRSSPTARGAGASRRSTAREKSALARALADGAVRDRRRGVGAARPRSRERGAPQAQPLPAIWAPSAVNVPDYPKSGARASALALGRRCIEQQGQVETLLHYSCRDRHADRHAVRSGRRARDGPAQRAAHDRQSGAAGHVSPTRRRCSTSTRSA